MATRIVAGLAMALGVAALLMLAPKWLLMMALAVLVGVCFFEYTQIMQIPHRAPVWLAGGMLLLLLWALLQGKPSEPLAVFFLGVIGLWLLHFTENAAFSTSIAHLNQLVFGVAYILMLGVPLAFMIENGQRGYIFLLLACTHAGDTAAFFAGKTWGNHLFAPRLSPKKTWEGFAGGLTGSMAAGVICKVIFVLPISIPITLGISLAIGTFAALGDLAESMLKRSQNVKDSGHLIPGHGGLLDRVDGLFFSGPILYLLLQLI